MKAAKEKEKCPYCREEIAPGAVICKHCRSIINAPLKKKKKTPFWYGSYMLGVYSGIIFSGILIYIFFKIFGSAG
jgi:predicted nucleic acid-binding Zn ribbon protein